MKSKEQGSLTIEAAFVLSFFVIAMLSWILIMRTLKLESMMQHALDQTALAMSDQISMAHTLTGNDGAISPFLEKLGEKIPNIPDSDILQETIQKVGLAIDSNLIFPSYFGKGKGLAEEIEPINIQTTIDEDADLLTLSLSYDMELPGVLRPFGPIVVEQTTTTGLWLLTDTPVADLLGGNTRGENDSQNPKEQPSVQSIWQKNPIERGRIFLERRRQLPSAQEIKKGKYFDLYHQDGSLESALSINLFSTSYATGKGKDPMSYVLNRSAIQRKLESTIQPMMEEMKKMNNVIELKDGTQIPIAGHTMRLFVIVPEEAKMYAAELEALAEQISLEKGIDIEWHYEEKAFLSKEGE